MKKNDVVLKKLKHLFAFSAAVLALASCRVLSTPNNVQKLANDGTQCIVGGVLHNVEFSARTAMPADIPTIQTYTVSATNGSETKIGTVDTSQTPPTFFICLPFGEWVFTAQALDNSGEIVLNDTKTITLNESSQSIDFSLKYVQDSTVNGNVDLTIIYPTDTGISKIEWSLEKSTAATPTTVTDVSSGTLLIQEELQPGAYNLIVYFYDSSDVPIYRIDQIVNIYSNLTTSKFEGTAPYISVDGNVSINATEIKKFQITEFYVGGANANDSNSGTAFDPLASVQKAIEKIKTINDESTEYTIYVSGTVQAAADNTVASFSSFANSNPAKVKIVGNGENATLKGNGDNVIYVSIGETNLTLTLENLTITGGNAISGGGGIYAGDGNITVQNCEITGNETKTLGLGGGIYIYSNASLTIKDTLISNNTTANNGGGIYNLGILTLSSENGITEFSDNSATSNGNGVFNNGTLNVSKNVKFNADDIYLEKDASDNLKVVQIESGLEQDKVAKITPAVYDADKAVLSDNSSGALVSANYTKFEVTPEDRDGTSISWEITSEGKLKEGNILISPVYLDCASGSDTNDGSESGAPVKTLKQACELLNTNDADPTIIIKTAYTIQADENDVLDFSSCSKQVTIKRADGFAKPSDAGYQHDLELFIVDSAITVNMVNVILDGNDFTPELLVSAKLLKIVGGGTVNIGGDTILKNNKDAAISVGMAAGSGATSGTLKISGNSVKFENNAAQSYCGILNIEATGNVVINNCLFENNTLGYGYCIYNGGNLTLSGILQLKDTVGSSYHIFNNGKFILSGEISDGKNLYLGATSSLEIGTGFNNNSDKINLTLLSYTHGATILTAATGVTINQALCDKFNLLSSDGTACTEYIIKPKESTAVLALNPKLYVHGTGGTEISATANDVTGNGTLSKPYASVQKALEKIAAANDESTEYTIYVDGTVSASDDGTVANFSDTNLANAKVSIIGLGSTKAKLQGNSKNSSGTKNSVLLVSASESNLTLTLENLIITEGETTSNGGGIQMNAGSLTVENCEITGNTATSNGGGIYVDGGTDNTLPLVECSIKNCSFSANIAMVNGGAICVQGRVDLTIEESTFLANIALANGGAIYNGDSSKVKIKGGSITSSSVTNGSGGGVYVDGTFEMSGTAQISAGDDGKNDVYLNSGKYITVTGALTGTSPVATITPESYTAGTQVLAAGGSVTALTQAICNQFALSDTNFVIQPDGTKGVLKKLVVSAGGIEIEIPNYSEYTATLSPSSPAFGGSVTLTLKKNGTTVTPSSCTMELYTLDDLATPITTSSETSITIPAYLSALGNNNFKVRIVAHDDGVLILDDYYDITVQ